jgi:hypothetical protein
MDRSLTNDRIARGLDNVDAKGQTTNDFIDEANRRRLRAAVVYLQHADPSAVVDRSELVEALAGSWDALENFTSICRR